MTHRPAWNRLVIKIGSALLVDPITGHLNEEWLSSIAQDIAHLRQNNIEVILVSSGATALGRTRLNLAKSSKLSDNQAAAATGQIALASAYDQAFRPHDINVAQILLTHDDTETRRRYLNARNTIDRLLSLNIIPIINENDTVATEELRYGDNDRLAARVASMSQADHLILLSDIDGLYSDNPQNNPNAHYIDHVDYITSEIEAMAGTPDAKGVGTGGMITKIAAAKIATQSGCHMIICNGTILNPIAQYRQTQRGIGNGRGGVGSNVPSL